MLTKTLQHLKDAQAALASAHLESVRENRGLAHEIEQVLKASGYLVALAEGKQPTPVKPKHD